MKGGEEKGKAGEMGGKLVMANERKENSKKGDKRKG